MKDKIQISEEEYNLILDTVIFTNSSGDYGMSINERKISLHDAKEMGYIKNSKLEEAREYYDEYINEVLKPGNIRIAFQELMYKYEQAIKEVESK